MLAACVDNVYRLKSGICLRVLSDKFTQSTSFT